MEREDERGESWEAEGEPGIEEEEMDGDGHMNKETKEKGTNQKERRIGNSMKSEKRREEMNQVELIYYWAITLKII